MEAARRRRWVKERSRPVKPLMLKMCLGGDVCGRM
jgi:hypothetical protein